jgi:hypothetical protein
MVSISSANYSMMCGCDGDLLMVAASLDAMQAGMRKPLYKEVRCTGSGKYKKFIRNSARQAAFLDGHFQAWYHHTCEI